MESGASARAGRGAKHASATNARSPGKPGWVRAAWATGCIVLERCYRAIATWPSDCPTVAARTETNRDVCVPSTLGDCATLRSSRSTRRGHEAPQEEGRDRDQRRYGHARVPHVEMYRVAFIREQ